MPTSFRDGSLSRQVGTPTPQTEPLAGQVPNSAGGHAWPVDDWMRLRRFLVLGTEGGTYYIDQRRLPNQNTAALDRCIADDGARTVELIQQLATERRIPKVDTALFALAKCAAAKDPDTQQLALDALPAVATTGTHLFHFVHFLKSMRGFGRRVRRGVGRWYTAKEPAALGYQVTKYRQRDGWSHRDVLRVAHPSASTLEHRAIFDWITHGTVSLELPDQMLAAIELMGIDSVEVAARLIRQHHLPRECVPAELLAANAVWEALLERMPSVALLRNLATLTARGLIGPGSTWSATIAERLAAGVRAHPIQVLSGMLTYRAGHGVRGSQSWNPVPEVVDALDAAYEFSFGHVTPMGGQVMLACDVSDSMNSGTVAGVPGLTPMVASAAMTQVALRTESQPITAAFSDGLSHLPVSGRQRLDDVIQAFNLAGARFGGTDCALPMLGAQGESWKVDTFVIYTDNETWHGQIHPAEALRQYRNAMQQPHARLIVVGMTSNGFTIADPADPGMLDLVGFDAGAPDLMGAFARGEL